MNVWSSHPAVRELERFWRPLLCVAMVVVWLATRGRPSIWAALLSYFALIAFATLLLHWAARFCAGQRSIVLLVGWLSIGVLLLAYVGTERYGLQWTDAAGTVFNDRVRRWGGAVEYRRITRQADEGLGWSEGPMRDGKQHGRWERHEQRPPKVDFLWYWQGKPMSQQEWQQHGEGGG